MKNNGTASSAVVVTASPESTGWMFWSDLISAVMPNAKPSPSTSNSAARYQPGARSLRGSGTRVRVRTGTASETAVAISWSPPASPRGPRPSLCHAREIADKRLDLGRRESLSERRGHHTLRVTGRDVGVWIHDRGVDARRKRCTTDPL